MRSTIMEVDTKKLKYNIEQIKKYVGNKHVMPIVKANAYGTYINKRLETLNEFNIIAVAIVDEAIEIRKLGYNKNIFILNQPAIEDISDILEYNLTIGLSSVEFLEELEKIQNKIKVHIEIETGMNRTGVQIDKLQQYITKLKQNSNIIVEGVYTHLSSADYDVDYTTQQLKKFKQAVEIVKREYKELKYIHSQASSGFLNYTDDVSNLVRTGIVMYGFEPFENVKGKIDIKPVCTLKSKISFIKEIEEGESVSYSRRYKADKKRKIATIPIGYADGFRRELTNIGEVVINNKKAKVVGSVCMDSFMVDVTEIENIKVGTDVYIWDNDKIMLDEIAEKCNTINYEILTGISYRVPRVFTK